MAKKKATKKGPTPEEVYAHLAEEKEVLKANTPNQHLADAIAGKVDGKGNKLK